MFVRDRPPDSLAVLVVSCDKYADLWPAFFKLFRRYWPDCPFPIYLVSNHLEAKVPWVTTVKVGNDRAWSANVRRALMEVREKYVLMLLDDLFLVSAVDTGQITAIAAEFIASDGQCLKLNPTVPGDIRHAGRFDGCSPGTAYRVSTVLTLWSREVLAALLDDKENAWEFELQGSERSDTYPRFFTAKTSHFSIINGVIKGRWSRRAMNVVQRLSGGSIAPGRLLLSWPQEMLYQLALVRSRVFLRLTAGKNRRYHNWLRRIRATLSGKGI